VVAVPAVHGLARLAEAVHVEDGYEVVQLVEGGVLKGFPHRALGHLRVTAEDPDAVGELVQVLASQRDTDPDGEALPQRTGRDVHPGEGRRRVALQAAAELAEGQELLVGYGPRCLVYRVEQRRGVPLREDQVVVRRVPRSVEVVAQILAEEHGHELGRRHARGGVPRASAGARADAVHAQLLRERAPLLGANGLLIYLLRHYVPP
jgi:hypothetical protein